MPSRKRTVRGCRRPDPLAGIFAEEVIPLLEREPQLRAVTIFEELLRRHPELRPCVRRTLERRVRRWRAVHGPEQEVVFAQRHPPGRMGLWTSPPPGAGASHFGPAAQRGGADVELTWRQSSFYRRRH